MRLYYGRRYNLYVSILDLVLMYEKPVVPCRAAAANQSVRDSTARTVGWAAVTRTVTDSVAHYTATVVGLIVIVRYLFSTSHHRSRSVCSHCRSTTATPHPGAVTSLLAAVGHLTQASTNSRRRHTTHHHSPITLHSHTPTPTTTTTTTTIHHYHHHTPHTTHSRTGHSTPCMLRATDSTAVVHCQ